MTVRDFNVRFRGERTSGYDRRVSANDPEPTSHGRQSILAHM